LKGKIPIKKVKARAEASASSMVNDYQSASSSIKTDRDKQLSFVLGQYKQVKIEKPNFSYCTTPH